MRGPVERSHGRHRRIARVIDEESIAGHAGEVQGDAALCAPLPELHAKGGVLESFGVLPLVLAPQLPARHVFTPQFSLDPLKIRRCKHLDAGLGARIQQSSSAASS